MADKHGVSYRINLDRTKTTKWAQAQPVDYGGDDWGEEEYDEYLQELPPTSQRPPVPETRRQQSAWEPKAFTPAQRSFTNPVPITHGRNLSFDREDDGGIFPTGAHAGTEPQPLHVPGPGRSSSQRSFQPGSADVRNQAPLQVDTRFANPSPQTTTTGFRENQVINTHSTPMSAPVEAHDRRSHSSNRPALDDLAAARIDARSSKTTTPTHPPRKSSLSSPQPPAIASLIAQPGASPVQPAQETPRFVRPADIYKRVEEEREKERRSQESSRPSLDSATGVPRDNFKPLSDPNPPSIIKPVVQESTSQVARAPRLDTVREGESQSTRTSPQSRSFERRPDSSTVSEHPSSVNDHLHDPISSSSSSEQPSPLLTLPEIPFVSPFPTPNTNQPTPPLNILPRSTYNSRAEPIMDELPQFQRGVASPSPSTGYGKLTSGSTEAMTSDTRQIQSENLQHKPSAGFTSTVHRAFDDGRDNLSPSTTNETIPRSNSASTSGISPIISRKPDNFDYFYMPQRQEQTISEELTTPRGRPESFATIKPDYHQKSLELLVPPVVIPGFRRDSGTPSPDNSPARRPISTNVSYTPKAEQGVLSDTGSAASIGSDIAPRAATSSAAVPMSQPHVDDLSKPTVEAISSVSPERTSSDDWKEWQAQRQSFHAQHHLADNGNPSPTMSSPISRSETPAKGTVREIAEKLDGNSGRSTPVSTTGKEPALTGAPRPVANTRLESFRPLLPGGWQSDTITPSLRSTSTSTQDHTVPPPQPTFISKNNRTTSSDSIPTATAPRVWPPQEDGPLDRALAAAGNAMAGAFSGTAFSKKPSQYSDSDSEDEAYPGGGTNQHPPISATRDFASEASRPSLPNVATLTETPSAASPSSARDVESMSSERQTPVDFPAPLRTSRINEGSSMSPRVSTFNPSVSTTNDNAEQLQKDIVQSLTPKTSKLDDPTVRMAGHFPEAEHPESVTTGRASRAGYDDTLPQEYGSYWMDRPSTEASIPGQLDHSSEHVKSQTSSSMPASTSQPLVTSHIPHVSTPVSHDIASTRSISPIPTSVLQDDNPPSRPMLEQRFSWETTDHKHSTLNVRQAVAPAHPPTPPNVAESTTTRTGTTITPRQSPLVETSAFPTATTGTKELPEVADTVAAKNTPETSSLLSPTDFSAATASNTISSFPNEVVGFRSILGYNDPHRRIRAFDDNKRLYAEPNGLLDTWLSSLNNPEHADVFTNSRQPRVIPVASQADSQTSPRREAFPGSGTKQMQENTRQLLAAAGKYSGKAGFVAKGLFAKGKDKLRTVSAGDKVSLKGRRMSANDASPPITPLSERSTLPSTAPQLPAPKLETPVEEASWSLMSSTVDQIFHDPSHQHNRDSTTGQHLSQPGIRGELMKDTSKRHSTSALNNQQQLVRAGGVHDDSNYNDVTNPNSARITSGPIIDRLTPQQTLPIETDTSTRPLPKVTTDARTAAAGIDDSSRPNVSDKSTALSQKKSTSRQRRPSSISDISEVSRSPGVEEPAITLTRTVSPPPEELTNSETQEVTVFLSHDPSKEAEARQAREDAMMPPGHGSLPPYSGPTDRSSHARIAAGTPIMPVADLGSVHGSDRRVSGRPFSFMGTETLSSVPSYRPGSSPPPITPIEGPRQPSQAGAKKQGPDIMDHPAYRTSQDGGIRDPNPLPSSRRPPEHLDLFRQHSGHRGASDVPIEQYRIPGPYVQEYRPPKPKIHHDATHAPHGRPIIGTDQASTNLVAVETRSQPATPMDFRTISHTSTDPNLHLGSQASETDRTRIRSFGGLFRSRSGSHQRGEREEQARYEENSSEEQRKQRNVPFHHGSYNIASGSPLGDLPEEDAHQEQLNNQGGHRRTLSSDLLRSNPSGYKNQTDVKKKRSSGFTSFFSRSGNKDRNRPAAALSLRSDMSGPMQKASMQSLHTRATSPGSYQGIATERTSPNLHAMPRQDVYGHQNSVLSYNGNHDRLGATTSTEGNSNNHYRGERPDQLWVNTNNDIHAVNEPLTAPITTPYNTTPAAPYHSSSMQATSFSTSPPIPNTRANRDISYGQDRPYVPTMPLPTQAKPRPNIAEHVKDLHKRSRSPRLGRLPSADQLRKLDDDAARTSDIPNSVNKLGTFSNKKASPVGTQRPEEDQEKPWTLTLPSTTSTDEDDDDAYVMVNHEQASVGNGGRHEGNPRQLQTLHSVPEGVSPVESQREVMSYENNPAQPQQSREVKRVLLERTPSPFLNTSESREAKFARPQTVAERFMGIQAPARSTTPTTSPPLHQTRFTKSEEASSMAGSKDNATTTKKSSHSSLNSSATRTSTVLSPIPNDATSPREGAISHALSKQPELHPAATPSQRSVSPLPAAQHSQPPPRNYMSQDHPTKVFAPVELPGSRPEGYESDDEPIMSATAYPGQEWMPVYADDGKWDD